MTVSIDPVPNSGSFVTFEGGDALLREHCGHFCQNVVLDGPKCCRCRAVKELCPRCSA